MNLSNDDHVALGIMHAVTKMLCADFAQGRTIEQPIVRAGIMTLELTLVGTKDYLRKFLREETSSPDWTEASVRQVNSVIEDLLRAAPEQRIPTFRNS